ncbi:MAG: C69 family dipeptidase [Myxococcota bacterium]
MCDTMVASGQMTADGRTWLAKNSDREPGEAQVVEHLPRRENLGRAVQCTWIDVPQSDVSWECVLSRPFWMWGAEMGVNEHGVAVGNEAVFTRLPVAETGLTGMDLVRLALERATSAREAIDIITRHIELHGQGGRCGYRHSDFRYHNSFAIADGEAAWILETAGPHWAAVRVETVRTISNGLTIEQDYDLISEHAISFAIERGWARSEGEFGFRSAYADPAMTQLAGAEDRRFRTRQSLAAAGSSLAWDDFADALRDHAGMNPARGWRMAMPCAHASWWPTRTAGQTTGSMIARLGEAPIAWLTGTSSPCASVFKPVVLGGELVDAGPAPGAGWDGESLFWRHERLHRALMRDHVARGTFDDARRMLESELRRDVYLDDPSLAWHAHRRHVDTWADRAWERARHALPVRPNQWFWRWHDWLDEVPQTLEREW